MKSTISDVRQLFNIKAFAYGVTVDNLAEGQTGIFPANSDTSITAANATFANLPDRFSIVSKLNGQIYYSMDTIEKAYIKNAVALDYQAQVAEEWEVTPENCECITSAQVQIRLDEDSLIRRDGLTWTHSDFVVELAPKELECLCNTGNPSETYQNNVFTQILANAINAKNSPFYEAVVKNDAGTELNDAAVTAFIAANETVNTDEDETNDGGVLTLVVRGKIQAAGTHKDLEVNYTYPRGVRLHPTLITNENSVQEFTQTADLAFELNAGYDLRQEEFECMNNYTGLNYYPQLSDGIASNDLVYQFENGVNYDVVTFEFSTDKVERTGDGDRKGFVVCLAAETGSAVATANKALFGL